MWCLLWPPVHTLCCKLDVTCTLAGHEGLTEGADSRAHWPARTSMPKRISAQSLSVMAGRLALLPRMFRCRLRQRHAQRAGRHLAGTSAQGWPGMPNAMLAEGGAGLLLLGSCQPASGALPGSHGAPVHHGALHICRRGQSRHPGISKEWDQPHNHEGQKRRPPLACPLPKPSILPPVNHPHLCR